MGNHEGFKQGCGHQIYCYRNIWLQAKDGLEEKLDWRLSIRQRASVTAQEEAVVDQTPALEQTAIKGLHSRTTRRVSCSNKPRSLRLDGSGWYPVASAV